MNSILLFIKNRSPMTKVILGFILLVLILSTIKAFQIYKAMQQGAFTPPPEAISSTVAREVQWEDTYEAVSTLGPVKGTILSAEEAGKISRVHFESGAKVEEGALLVELDTLVEEAKRKGALAIKSRTFKAFERAQTLKQKNAISNDEYDNIAAQYQQAAAEVDALEATIARKKIIAPFAGVTGIRTVNVGQYVSAGTPVVPLFSLDELYVNFSAPQYLAPLVRVGQKITMTTDAAPGKQFEGVVSAVNPNIDEASRNLSVQGKIANTSGDLRSGMFATVLLSYGTPQAAIVVPVTSIQYAPYGDSVYVVEKKEGGSAAVRQQFVKLGAKRGDLVSILSGMHVGEEVATSGLFKLRPGAAVQINNNVTPSDSIKPNPQDS